MNAAKNLAIYVHWPWCLAKCPYCDFNAHVAVGEIPRREYVGKVLEDLRYVREIAGQHSVSSVFFGGGTPSLMEAGMVNAILAEISHSFHVVEDAEITVECNPTSSSENLFQNLKHVGVNRVSVGVQSLQPQLLEFLGRKHDVGQAIVTLDIAQNIIVNVNADLIFGLPNQTLDGWMGDLATVARMGLNHISCYQLTIEPQTHFFNAVKRGEWEPLNMDVQADFMAETAHFLGTQGLTNYEISNFSKPGFACRHNVHVWQYGDYAGVGAGAHGRLTLTDRTRVATQVTKHPRNYLKHTTAQNRMKQTPLHLAEQWREAILSGLRLKGGIDVMNLELRLGGKLLENVNGKPLAVLSQMGFLEHTCKRIEVTSAGWPLLDSVLGQLLDV